jgi:hypothetical protein
MATPNEPSFFDEDFWRNVVAGIFTFLIATAIMSAAAVAAYKFVFDHALSNGRAIAFLFALTVFCLSGFWR